MQFSFEKIYNALTVIYQTTQCHFYIIDCIYALDSIHHGFYCINDTFIFLSNLITILDSFRRGKNDSVILGTVNRHLMQYSMAEIKLRKLPKMMPLCLRISCTFTFPVLRKNRGISTCITLITTKLYHIRWDHLHRSYDAILFDPCQ